MVTIMDKTRIIQLKEQGYSNREAARKLNIHRKTVAKYWNEHVNLRDKIKCEKDPLKQLELQEKIVQAPKYDSSSRNKRVLTVDFYEVLNKIIREEILKEKLLRTKKQNLTKKQIHAKMKSYGYKVGYSTLCNEINHIKGLNKECFIRQEYNFGDRLEFDFGEVHLYVNKEVVTYYLAVLSSPASNFRWCFLYENQKQEVFLDAHVQFFDMTKGVWKEVVYDNMKNVVSKFIGKNGKIINDELLKLSTYYGFSINTTNAYKGNEKGHVENSVKTLRNLIFADRVEFKDLSEARNYMNSMLIQINLNSEISKELPVLKPSPPKYEIAKIASSKVDKYSFIQIETNKYSVPEYLVGYQVVVKIYFDKILIYSNEEFVCSHKRLKGKHKYSVNIKHYLKTLLKKPGAVRNSLALKSNKELYIVFNKYYYNKPKDFINILYENRKKSIADIINILKDTANKKIFYYEEIKINHSVSKPQYLNNKTLQAVSMYNNMTLGGVNYGN